MNRIRCLLAMCGLFVVPAVHADIYKCVDDGGHTTYTNDKPGIDRKNCVLMAKEQAASPAPKNPANTAKTTVNASTPASFPKIDAGTQKSRDNDRQKILQTELETEMRLLSESRKELAEQESVRQGDEKNYQKYLDRIQGYKDRVALHERNIEALNKEIAKLR